MATEAFELAVDGIELLTAVAIVFAYGYFVLVEGRGVDNEIIEGLVIIAALAIFGDQYQEHLGRG